MMSVANTIRVWCEVSVRHKDKPLMEILILDPDQFQTWRYIVQKLMNSVFGGGVSNVEDLGESGSDLDSGSSLISVTQMLFYLQELPCLNKQTHFFCLFNQSRPSDQLTPACV